MTIERTCVSCDQPGCLRFHETGLVPFKTAMQKIKAAGWHIRRIGPKTFRHYCPDCIRAAAIRRQAFAAQRKAPEGGYWWQRD